MNEPRPAVTANEDIVAASAVDVHFNGLPFKYLQSLWLTSWFGSNNNNSSSSKSESNRSRSRSWNRRSGKQSDDDDNVVDVGVYTLQQPHKFPLQLDVYSGNCSFDYQQHEQPSGHYQSQQQQQQQGRQRQQLQYATASTAQEQSTLSIQPQKLKSNPKGSQRQQQQQQGKQQRFLSNSSQIYETKFIESSAVQAMDDMVYQCSNQNSIYVLNAGYNAAYGNFGIHATSAMGREMDGSKATTTTVAGAARTRNSIGASCSSAACSLQHKFKSFGNSSATAAAAAATTTTTPETTNYINPVATSMSAAMCSPATAALQKLFNCSSHVGAVGIGGVCPTVSHRNQDQTQSCNNNNNNGNGNNNTNTNNNNNNNNNCSVGSHNNGCLSTTAANRIRCDPHENNTAGTTTAATTTIGATNGTVTVTVTAGTGTGAGTLGAGALPLLDAVANKQKCSNVKSTLIAKKTKFLKFLEEEKWRSRNALLTTTEDATACGVIQPNSSNEADLYTASSSTLTAASTSPSTSSSASLSIAGHSGSKNNNSNMKNHNQETVADAQQNKLNNWSMHNENNYKQQQQVEQQQEQQQKQELMLQRQKEITATSSYELYQEAADILGLSCSLCDNCRCLDCQSGYFDCADDDDESYSEQSLMDEYDDYDYGYSFSYDEEQQALPLTTAQLHAGLNQSAMIQRPNMQDTQQQQQQQHQQEAQQQEQQPKLCYALDCQLKCSKDEEPIVNLVESEQLKLEQNSNHHDLDSELMCRSTSKSKSDFNSISEHCVALDFDLINATSTQVMQNCLTFNDLSLLDAEKQVTPIT